MYKKTYAVFNCQNHSVYKSGHLGVTGQQYFVYTGCYRCVQFARINTIDIHVLYSKPTFNCRLWIRFVFWIRLELHFLFVYMYLFFKKKTYNILLRFEWIEKNSLLSMSSNILCLWMIFFICNLFGDTKVGF